MGEGQRRENALGKPPKYPKGNPNQISLKRDSFKIKLI